MKKMVNEKFVTNQFLKSKTLKREDCVKRTASNISLNLISVNVLPQNACWSDMEGFRNYKYGPFRFYFRNANDEIIAGLNFYFSYLCSGKFNSAGKYLSNATVLPEIIFANPGYHLACNMVASEPVNFGTKADPIAGVILTVQMQVSSYYKLKSNTDFYVENTLASKALPNFDEPVNVINLTMNNDCAKTVESDEIKSENIETKIINSNRIISSAHSNDTDLDAGLRIKSKCGSKLNTEEQFVSVGIRGDCSAYLVCGYGY